MADPPGNPAARELGFCPCCGYRTLAPGRPGSYEHCPVCDWLDDPDQFCDDEHVCDANDVALSDARENVREHGACVEGAVPNTREPDEPRDPNWPYDSAE